MRTRLQSSGTRLRLGAVLLTAALIGSPAHAQTTVDEPATFRMEKYAAPVPATLKGARVVTTEEAEKLWREHGATFVDVLPRPPKPKDLPADTVWHEPPHADIPGSVWLADVGFGGLAPDMEAWYRDSLAEVTGGDPSRPLLIYCRADCWMSWNAAKRAVGWGYANVIWYPGGVEGWQAAGLPLEERQPLWPRQAE